MPDVIAIIEGPDIATTDAVIDRIVEIPEVIAADSRVTRWIEETRLCRFGSRQARPRRR